MAFELKDIFAPAAIAMAWIGSLEWRLRNKVNHKLLDANIKPMQEQVNRIESHLWQLLQNQGIKPQIEPPDEIKNNSL